MRVIPALMLGASCADPAEAPGTGATEPEVELSDSTNAACAIPPELAPVPVDPSAPICFDWSGFTSDGEFDAANIKYALVYRIVHGARETVWKVTTDGLTQADTNGAASVDVATGCFDDSLDFFFGGTCEGEATAMLLLVDSLDNFVSIPLDGCGGAVANPVVLKQRSMPPLEAWFELGEAMPARSGFPALDWSALTESCWGEPFDPLEVGGLRMVPESGSFDADLKGLWALDSARRVTATLAMTMAVPADALRDAEGEPFYGFEAGDSWHVALDDAERELPVFVGRIVAE